MAIKDILRRFFGKEAIKEEDTVMDNVSIDSLNNKIKSELEALEKKKEIAKKEMAENRAQFAFGLENQITLLRNIDLRERKEIEKIKLITSENLKVYILHLEKLIEDLAKNNDSDAKAYGEHIFKAIDKFKHFSYNSFEKATILIGKELEQTRSVIREFSEIHGKIVSAHRDIFEKEEHLQQLQDILENYNSIKLALSENERESAHMSEKMQNILQEKNNKEKELNALINSSSYQTVLEEKKRKEEEQSIFNSEIVKLKQRIDLKALARLFHNDAKKMEIINAYKDNFLLALNNDEQLIIAEIVKLARPELKFKEELTEIRIKYISLQESGHSTVEKDIFGIKEIIQKFTIELNAVENELIDYRKKQDKIKGRLENIELELKDRAKMISWNIDY